MVKTIYVRGPTLARLAVVSVFLSIGNAPARRVITLRVGETPTLWQRAVNRQPGSRSDNS